MPSKKNPDDAFVLGQPEGLLGEIIGSGALGALFGVGGGLYFAGFQARKLADNAEEITELMKSFKVEFDILKSEIDRVFGIVEEVLLEVKEVVDAIGEILDEKSIQEAQTDIGVIAGLIEDYALLIEKGSIDSVSNIDRLSDQIAIRIGRIEASKRSRLEKFVLTASPLAVWSYAKQLTLTTNGYGRNIDYRQFSVFRNAISNNIDFLREMDNLYVSVKSLSSRKVAVKENRLYYYLENKSMIDEHGPLLDYSKYKPGFYSEKPRRSRFKIDGFSKYLRFIFEADEGEYRIRTEQLLFQAGVEYGVWVPVRRGSPRWDADFPNIKDKVRPTDTILRNTLESLKSVNNIRIKLMEESNVE